MNPIAYIIRTVASLAVAAAIGAFLYLGPGTEWISSFLNRAEDKVSEAADNAAGMAKRDDDGNIVKAGKLKGSDVQVGDCLLVAELDEEGGNVYAKATPCTEAHDSQVIGSHYSMMTSDDKIIELCYEDAVSFVGADVESLADSMGLSLSVVTVKGQVRDNYLCTVETDDLQPTLTQSLAGQAD
ncbi:MAG: hypothetical protein FWH11_07755 [Micrococcales bacterium]|nr:hypothetical protein [Micrococcales bacterium]